VAGAVARGVGRRASGAALALAGAAVRACGRFVGAMCGGRPALLDSPLLAPVSEYLVGPDSTSLPMASVIVPAKASHTSLLLTLHALERQEMDEPYEVLAGTEEGCPLAADIRRLFPQVRFCPIPPRAGPGGARNALIPFARGQVVAFTDADDLPERTWLRQMTALVAGHGGRPVRGWVAIHQQMSAVDRACRYAEEGIARPRRPLVVAGLSGANMALGGRYFADQACRFTAGLYGAEEVGLLEMLPEPDRVVLLSPNPEVHEMRCDRWGQSLRRMRALGYGSGHLRRRKKIRGSLAARWLVLAPLLILARYLLTARRIIHCGGLAAALDFLRLTPITLCMLMYYVAGFVAGARQARRDARARELS
ncbi:MAG: glycosyltransferase, partial [Planctomycetota bacterium]